MNIKSTDYPHQALSHVLSKYVQLTLDFNMMKKDQLFLVRKKLAQGEDKFRNYEGLTLEDVLKEEGQNVLVFHFGKGTQQQQHWLAQLLRVTVGQVLTLPGNPYSLVRQVQRKQLKQFQLLEGGVRRTTLEGRPVFLILTSLKAIRQDLLKDMRCTAEVAIPGVAVIQDYISREEESQILKVVSQGEWTKLKNRRVQHYGHAFLYGTNTADEGHPARPMPELLLALGMRIAAKWAVCQLPFDQLTINEYRPGEGIPAHCDQHSPFEEVFASVSLGSDVVMRFSRQDCSENLLLPTRSVLVLSGEGRYGWKHEIASRKADYVDGCVVFRSRRVSLTYRKLRKEPCTCSFPAYCDFKKKQTVEVKGQNALIGQRALPLRCLQNQFVRQTYQSLGPDFSNAPQPPVIQFVKKIEGALLDVGCGNGAYFKYAQLASLRVGVEPAFSMAQSVLECDLLVQADCRYLPFKASSFDAVICVAVLHHLASQKGREQAVREIVRVLKPGGRAMVAVWGKGEGDVVEDWGMKPGLRLQRFIHYFCKEQLQSLFKTHGVLVQRSFEDYQNYYIQIMKVTL